MTDILANDIQDVFSDKETSEKRAPLAISADLISETLWGKYCLYFNQRELETVSTHVFSKLLLTALRTLG